MKRSSFIVALALSSASLLSPMLAAADQIQKTGAVKQIQVRNAVELQRAFNLAAAEGRQAIEISCFPASSSWCAEGFVAACDKNGGGMSSDPDGGVTCSLPQHE